MDKIYEYRAPLALFFVLDSSASMYYVIKHQRAIIFSNANIFCVMLISAPIFSAFLNWLIVLLFFRRIYDVYYYGIAAYHVLCGILGFLSIIILHVFDRLKKTKNESFTKNSTLS